MRKKNINLLIAEIQNAASTHKPFKITCRNAIEYSNKILVHEKDLNKPSNAEEFVRDEMNHFKYLKTQSHQEKIRINIREKSGNISVVQKKLTEIQGKFSYLLLQDIIEELKFLSKKELDKIRQKLFKLEMNLAFKLQNGQLQPYLEQSFELFLKDLTEIINKSNKIL